MRGIMKARSKEINIEKEEKEMKVKYESFTLPKI